VNVGLNRATSLKQLLAEIGEVLGGLPPVSHAEARAGDIKHSRANNERLLQRFRFDQPTPMSVGLARLLGR
ncbi:NAD-dependent dehydratase, partial [Pseudomonas aeruginosa]|nr:NAD-dependent dehydratase [Pseudomonas aeruginosa]